MDEIKPATNHSENNHLSAQEFQHTLRNWFDEKSLESDLRSYLRLKMINHLKHTEIGHKLVQKPNLQSSLSKQAVNLVVADYLLQNNCHYTFSVFNSETNILPEFNNGIFQSKSEANRRFQLENLLNILELIGISKKSRECERICEFYYNSKENVPILGCLILLLKNGTTKEAKATKRTINLDIEIQDEFMGKILEILINTPNLSSENINELVNKIQPFMKAKTTIFENKIKELHKERKILERKLTKTQEIYEKFVVQAKDALEKQEETLKTQNNQKIQQLTEEIAILNSKLLQHSKLECNLKHCDSACSTNIKLIHDLNKKTEKLIEVNTKQKLEIEVLSKQCKDFASEFNLCQSKLNLLSTRIVEENGKQIDDYKSTKKHEILNETTTSDSITEEILKQARMKLKQLEMESMEIDKTIQFI